MKCANSRTALILTGLLLCTAASPAWGLGLGEARVDSFLNQPLDVTVRLLDVSDAQLESLTVQPATAADYERLGLMSDALALGLEAVIDTGERPPVVRIRSSRPVSDPVVQVLVDARWANGRLLREYTLFLDPPTVEAPAPAPPVAADPRPRPAPEAAPEPRAEPAPERPVRAPVQRDIGERYGPVASGDTLWRIARDWRPDSSLSMNQVMLAILDRNPAAFRDGNINHLLRGAELEMPSIEEVAAIDLAEATERVRRQSEAFRSPAERVPVVSDAAVAEREPAPEPDLTESETPATETAEPAAEDSPVEIAAVEHRLELVPPVDAEGTGGAGGEAEEFSRLQENLARTEEELLAARLEAEELRARLDALEREFAEQLPGVSLADAELAELESALREARLERQGTDDAGPAAPAEPRVTQVGSSGSFVGGLFASPLFWILLAVLVVMGLVLVVLYLRNRGPDDDYQAPPTSPSSSKGSGSTRSAAAGAGGAGGAGGDGPILSARDRVREDPEHLPAHLALLKLHAGRDQDEEFAEALEDMFGYVNTGSEPSWIEALNLAARQVPDHPLVSGSEDLRGDRSAKEKGNAGVSLPDSGSEDAGDADLDNQTRDILRMLEEDQLEHPDSTEFEDSDAADPGKRSEELGAGGEEDDEWYVGSGSGRLPGAEDGDSDEPLLDLDLDMSELDDPDQAGDQAEPAESAEGVERFLREQEEEFSDRPRSADSNQERSAEETDPSPEPSTKENADPDVSLDWPGDGDTAAGGEDEAEKDPDAGADDIFSLGEDDVEVKLDLARAYISMDDPESARGMLEEVIAEGSDEQQQKAQKLLDEL